MKHRSGIIAAIAVAALLPAAGFAADAAPAPKADSRPATATAAKVKAADARIAEGKPAKPEAKCEYVTGSRIRRNPPTDCDHAAPGARTISAEEIQETGEFNVTDALRKLDTRVQ